MFVSKLEWMDRDERPWTVKGFWSVEHVLEGPLVFESGEQRHVIDRDLTRATNEELQNLLDEALIRAWPPVNRTSMIA